MFLPIRLSADRKHQHTETPSWYVNGPNPPEILHEWLTLRMDRPAMEKYVDESNITRESRVIQAGTFTRDLVEKTVMNCLEGVNNSRKSKFQLRLAGEGDVDTIARLVQGLAVYEKEPEAVNITANHYLRDGSGSEEPLFYCLMLDQAGDNEHIYTCGMALVYFGYTLGEGRFLYLEDLFLEEAYRKQGGGSLAMQTLARLSLALACSQFYWCALDWNTPALNLYNKIGAKVQEGLLTTRYTGEALTSFASDE
jgi:GNAT superfamily N-acetyltransferase